MFKFSKIVVLFIMFIGLVACSSEYPNRPSDVRKDIWDNVNEMYLIIEENRKIVELPTDYDIEKFFVVYDKYIDDLDSLSENEYNLLNETTQMIYYLSEWLRMVYSTKENFTEEQRQEMITLYKSSRRNVASILGNAIDG